MRSRTAHILCLATALVLSPSITRAQPRPRPAGEAPPKILTREPKLVRFVEAEFPASERAAGKSAEVVLQLVISATGDVDDVSVVTSAGAAFDVAALGAARKFQFEPAEIDGKPAPVKILYRYGFTFKAEAPTTAVFAGRVNDRVTKRPIQGARIEVDGQVTTTDGEGKFRFDKVTPGKLAVSIVVDGYPEVRTDETFDAGKQIDASYDLSKSETSDDGPKDDFEVVVQAPPLQKSVVATEVSAEQALKVPGTRGDVLKVVENLPGVARAQVGSGALVVWGASPQDTRVYLDGVPVPLLYHFGGVRSVIHADLVRSVELSPGGYGAQYGRGLGGLVTVQTRAIESEGFHGSAAADLLDASASVRAALTPELRVLVAARRSHLDEALRAATSKDVGELFPTPRYHDGQARIFYDLARDGSIEITGLLSSDAVSRSVASPDPAQAKSEDRTTSFTRVFARYRRDLDDGGEIVVTPYVGTDRSSQISRFGGTPTTLSSDGIRIGTRASWRGRVSSMVTLTAGLDAEANQVQIQRLGPLGAPAREGDVRVFGQAPSGGINADTWEVITTSAAPFGEIDIELLDSTLHFVSGARLEPVSINGSRRTPVVGATPSIGFLTQELNLDPRLSLRWEPSKQARFTMSYGVYHQPPQPDDLSAVFGNPLLSSSRATHWVIGAAIKPLPWVSVEPTAFTTQSQGLAIRSTLASPRLAEALVQEGRGRTIGAQILLRRETAGRFFGWLSYTILRSERTREPNGGYTLFDLDQTHVLTALGSYDLGRGWEIGARFRYATGYPRTPVLRAYYDVQRDAYSPVFGAPNSDRLPAFLQIDARVSKRTRVGPGQLDVYLDVQNVTDRSNAEEVVYSVDYRQKRYITGLPILPVAGARFAW